jgi:hypothetical protein
MKLSTSLALQEIFDFFDQTSKVKMQRLNKRFYRVFIPGLVRKVHLFDLGNVALGAIVFPGQNYVNVLDPKKSLVEWKKLPVQIDETAEEILHAVARADLQEAAVNMEKIVGMLGKLKSMFFPSKKNEAVETFSQDIRWAMWPKII